jgi:transcriptional regulator with XRE-family HTH domain
MTFGERLKAERTKKGWTQDELAEKLFVSRQSVSKWENGANYPNIEILIKLSDLFGVTVDELLRSDEQLTRQVIRDSKQLKYPRLKVFFDLLFMAGVVMLVVKIGILLLNKVASLDIPLIGGTFLWNFGSLFLIVVAGIGSNALKDKYKTTG